MTRTATTLLELIVSTDRFIRANVNMPGKDGFQTLQELRANHAVDGVPVVFFTTSTRDDDQARSAQLGADFVQKPLEFDAFEKAVLGILDRAPPSSSRIRPGWAAAARRRRRPQAPGFPGQGSTARQGRPRRRRPPPR